MAVSFGKEPRRTTTMSSFMVVKGRSSYNAIVGHLILVAMKPVTSIYHLCLKFLILCSIRVVRGNHYEVRMCYTTSVRSAPANSKGKRTAREAGLAEEAFTIGVPDIQYELDP